MKIRLIAGKYGGRSITAPEGHKKTHPMSERARNAMFNSISSEIEGAVVLDAFAGTGSIGLEAISRGAQHATFVERDKIAQKCIDENITTLNATEQCTLIRTTVSNWLETKKDSMYDIIFVDPPYHDPQFSTVARLFELLKPNGLMVLSHTGISEVPRSKNDIVVVDNRCYANLHLTYYRRVSAE